MVRQFPGQAEFREENLGESPLAEKYGVKLYPAIFVNEVLIARPTDFFRFGGKEGGRYMPWRDAKNHEKFKQDLKRNIEIALRGERVEAAAAAADAEREIQSLPAITLTDLNGAALALESLRGRVVLVEFWATWCPPCISTLGFMRELHTRHGNRVTMIGIAMESDEAEVKKLVAGQGIPYSIVMGNAEIQSKFGEVLSIPTLFLFDRSGNTAKVFYGAPKDLHESVDRMVTTLSK